MLREELAAWLRLLLTPGVSRENSRRLLASFASPESIWLQTPDAWAAVVGPKLSKTMQGVPDRLDESVERHLHWIGQSGDRSVITLGDDRYPTELTLTADPPLLLFVQGQWSALTEGHRLAMVGSRNPTPQGAQNAHQFASALAGAGLCIVSGLALGIDGAAHEGALAGGGTTIAVVGTGLDRVYPSRHRDLAHRIAERGALVSEYPLGTPPMAPNFPLRNRIIAGLSQGTLVVEAALQSGSLITARMAAEQGREVFAIPGSIHAPQSRGCHALIRQGAKLVESAHDVLEELRLTDPAPRPMLNNTPTDEADDDCRALLRALGHDPVSLDALLARTGLSTARLQAQLLELELQGEVGRLPGGLLQRLSAA